MPFQHKRLVGPSTLTASALLLYYTVPANKTAIIKQVVVTNTTASAATFTLRIGVNDAIFNAVSVAANDTMLINLSQVLAAGETLYAVASVDSTLNLTISGIENDGPIEPTETYIADGSVTAAKLSRSAGAVMVFADSSARSTTIPSPTQGMMTYLENTDEVQVYDGSTWLTLVVTNDDNQIVTNSYIQADQFYAYGSSSAYAEFVSSNPTGAFFRLGRGTSTSVTEQMVLGSAAQLVSSGTLANSAIMARGGTLTLGTGTFAGITIDANQRVTMPSQPVFFVSNENGSSIAAVNKHTFNIVAVNNGNHWSAANNRFTAPVTGLYFFTMSILNGAGSALYLSFRKNGTGVTLGYYPRSYTANLYESNTASGYISLAAGDYIELWVETGTAHNYHSFFSGHLVA